MGKQEETPFSFQLVFHQFIFIPAAEMKLGQPPISQKGLMDNKRMKTNKQTDVKD